MKKNQNNEKRLLWAFNPFQDKNSDLKKALSVLQRLSEQTRWPAEPVYVVNPMEANVVLEFSVPAKERYRSVATERSRAILKKLGAEQLNPTILVEKSLSLTASAKALSNYADQTDAAAILTSTRSKKGLRRLMGSFAEALLYQSKCPVILFQPGQKSPAMKTLLFISDLSPDSLRVFEGFCEFASRLGAKVHLFHSIPRPFSWASFAVDALLGPDRLSEKKYLLLTRKLREKDLKPFAETAKRHGIAFSAAIGIGGKDVAKDILKEALKRKANMIGVAGKSGRLKTRLLGSITQSLLAQTKLPMWIHHLR